MRRLMLLILSFLLGFIISYLLNRERVIIKEKQNVKTSEIVRVETLKVNNPYVKIKIKYDTLKINDTIKIVKTDTIFLFNMRKWTYTDNILTFSFIANYVDTNSFEYKINTKQLIKKPDNVIGFSIKNDFDFEMLYGKRLFGNFYLYFNFQRPLLTNTIYDYKFGVGILLTF